MTRSIGITLVLSLAASGAAPAPTRAQDVPQQQLARFTVLVPDLEPVEGADRGFGRDVAAALRDLLNTLATHEAIGRRDIERSLDEVDRDMDEVDCALARQLASRITARVVLCSSYEEIERDRFTLSAVFYDVGSGEAFTVEPTTRSDREEDLAARHIFDQFDTYVRQLRAAANCDSYAQSQLWEDALRNCDEALALNPDAVGARYRRARILFDSERFGESIDELERVLEGDPIHESALQLAGYVSATLGRSDDALGYYSRFLLLNPTNAFVRMRVAYDLATAGDPPGALLLIREGLDLAPDDAKLWEQLGGYSFTIGEAINREAVIEDGGSVAPEAEPYFRDAIEAYRRVFAAQGVETNPGHLRSIVTAHLRLGEVAEAIATADQALETWSNDATLWSVYADALRRANRLDAALEALGRVGSIDPAYPNLALRRGSWLLEDGRVAQAVEAMREVALADPDRADLVARTVLRDAHATGIQQDRYDYATNAIVLVKTLPNLSESTRHELNFWHGYSILRAAAVEQEPRTVETARAALPRFLEAEALLGDVGTYPSTVNVNIDELRDNVRTYIEIQEAIIRRGGRPLPASTAYGNVSGLERR